MDRRLRGRSATRSIRINNGAHHHAFGESAVIIDKLTIASWRLAASQGSNGGTLTDLEQTLSDGQLYLSIHQQYRRANGM